MLTNLHKHDLTLPCCRGKRCIALDLTKEEGQAVLLEMAKTADVFLQNARPGAADRNGFGYEALSAVNEELIYVSISGWGQTGPYARRPAYDAVMQTQTGFPVMQGGDDAPVMVNNFVCDKITSYQTAIAVLAALEAKSTGKCVGGQHIEISMLDSALAFFWSDAMGNTGAAYAGAEEGSVWNDEVGQPKNGRRAGQRILPTADGFAAMMIWPFAPHWDTVIKAFEITEPEFQDNKSREGLALIQQNYGKFFEILEAKFAARTNVEIDALAGEFELPLGVVVDIDDFQHHPQIQHMESIVEHEVGKLGRIREPRPVSAQPLPLRLLSKLKVLHTGAIDVGHAAEDRRRGAGAGRAHCGDNGRVRLHQAAEGGVARGWGVWRVRGRMNSSVHHAHCGCHPVNSWTGCTRHC